MTKKLETDPEIRGLLRELTDDEKRNLHKSLREEGCRDPIVVWKWKGKISILDGHHRWEYCEKKGIPYRIIEKSFRSKEKAKEWVIRNNYVRRHESKWDRCVAALKLKPHFQKLVKEQQKEAGREKVSKKSKKPIHWDKECARIANVSIDTIRKADYILEKLPKTREWQFILRYLTKGPSGAEPWTINRAYKSVKRYWDEREKNKTGWLDPWEHLVRDYVSDDKGVLDDFQWVEIEENCERFAANTKMKKNGTFTEGSTPYVGHSGVICCRQRQASANGTSLTTLPKRATLVNIGSSQNQHQSQHVNH